MESANERIDEMHGYRIWMILGILTASAVWWSTDAYSQQRAGAASSSTSQQSRKAGLPGDALIQYDADSGSLIIVTDEETNKHIGQVVKSLDRPVPQVLIKVLFLEVTHTNDVNLGFEGAWTKKTTHNFSTQVDTQSISDAFGVASQTTGGFYKILTQDLNLTLRALAEVTKFEVLSRPSVLTRNNKEATINVGQQVPIITNSTVSALGNVNNTVQYVDLGIILTVTPHISEDGLVAMDVAPEISALTDQTVPIGNNNEAPVFSKRSATTSVVVPDGCTVVIGGLMEDNNTNNTKKLPILGYIPVLGGAFRSKSDSKTKTELLIFLTPHVVQGANQLEAMSITEKGKALLPSKAFKETEINRFLDIPKGASASPTEGRKADQPATDPSVVAPATPEAPTAPQATPEVTAPVEPPAPDAQTNGARGRNTMNKGVMHKSKH
jgi:general secretion pathway protein D